jgi:5'-nucleotidase
MPAGLVLPTAACDDDNDKELRVAFDFDGVLADDEAEIVYDKTHDLEMFHQSELKKAATPHNPGPLKDLITKMSFFQKLEMKKAAELPGYKPALRVAIVTARDAPANERLITTLKAWGLTAVEAFFMGGVEKKRVLDILRPHIFFDDQLQHLEPAAASVPSVHIPFGIKNRPNLKSEPSEKSESARNLKQDSY